MSGEDKECMKVMREEDVYLNSSVQYSAEQGLQSAYVVFYFGPERSDLEGGKILLTSKTHQAL